MVRKCDEAVEVVRDAAGAPTGFRWRSGRYVVHDVLAQWRERRAWWTGPTALALHGRSGPEAEGDVRADLTTERLIWRVAAGPIRSGGQAGGGGQRGGQTRGAARGGVYDLCQEVRESARPQVSGSQTAEVSRYPGASSEVAPWRLLRIVD